MGLENASNDCDAENQIDFIGNLHSELICLIKPEYRIFYHSDNFRNVCYSRCRENC